MGAAARKAIDDLTKIGSGQSESLKRLEETRPLFQQRLAKTLRNLPEGEIVEVPSAPEQPPPEPAEAEK